MWMASLTLKLMNKLSASKILKAGSDCLIDRATERDSESERSMAKCIATFNALTGSNMSEYHGWVFMALLKLSRAENNQGCKVDDFVDGAAYIALAGECKQSVK